MKILRLILIFVGFVHICNAQGPQTKKGKIDFYPSFKSNVIPAIDLAIWLPSNYDAKQKYSVLYGQPYSYIGNWTKNKNFFFIFRFYN
jgi:hypothetical protein